MKTNVVIMAAVILLALCSVVEAKPAEKMLRVVSQVHAHPDVSVNAEEKRAKRHGHCVDTGAVNEDPVCASNGRQYLNEEVLEFHKCLIQAEYGEIIEVVDMEICKNAKQEDSEHPGVPDIDYMQRIIDEWYGVRTYVKKTVKMVFVVGVRNDELRTDCAL